jgi:hypothetical protein
MAERLLLGSMVRIYITLLGLTALAEILGFWTAKDSNLSRLAFAVGEAFFVALVLALSVDPYLKVRGFRESARQISESYFWETVAPYCPIEYRTKIKELARYHLFASSETTEVAFRWADAEKQVVQLVITRETTLRNTSPHIYAPSRHLWLLASTPGHHSEYLRWRVVHEPQGLDETQDQTSLSRFVESRSDGALTIDEARITETLSITPAIPPDGTYRTEQKGKMYRRAGGYLPLLSSVPVASGRIRCYGEALQDLEVRCMFGAGFLPVREGEQGGVVFVQPRLSAPGEGYLLSWKTKERPATVISLTVVENLSVGPAGDQEM